MSVVGKELAVFDALGHLVRDAGVQEVWSRLADHDFGQLGGQNDHSQTKKVLAVPHPAVAPGPAQPCSRLLCARAVATRRLDGIQLENYKF
jgi:hypothetical protein